MIKISGTITKIYTHYLDFEDNAAKRQPLTADIRTTVIFELSGAEFINQLKGLIHDAEFTKHGYVKNLTIKFTKNDQGCQIPQNTISNFLNTYCKEVDNFKIIGTTAHNSDKLAETEVMSWCKQVPTQYNYSKIPKPFPTIDQVYGSDFMQDVS